MWNEHVQLGIGKGRSYHCVYLGVLNCGGGETELRIRDSRFIGRNSVDWITIRGLVVQLLVVLYISKEDTWRVVSLATAVRMGPES